MQDPNLAQKLGRGVAVDALGTVFLRGLSVVLSIVVARVLVPQDYGAVSLALAAFGVTEILTDLSLGSALARRPELAPSVVDVAWTFTNLRSGLLSLAFFASSDVLAKLLGHPEIARYLKVLAFSPLALNLANLHVVKYHRQLRFGRAFLIENSRSLFSTVFSLAMLVTTHDAMSLALGPVVGNALTSALTWVFVSPRPRVSFDWADAKDLLHFGRWLTGQNILAYLFGTLDNLYVGRFVGLAALGGYALAWRMVNTSMTLFVRGLPRMLVATYAKVQDDRALLAKTAASALKVSSGFGFLVAAGTVVCAKDLLAVLGGKNEWPDAVALTRILTFAALAKLLQNVLGSTFHAVGNARSMTVSAAIQLLGLAPALLVGQQLGGVQGIAVGVALASWLRLVVTSVWLARDFDLPLGLQLKSVLPGMTLGAASALAVLPLQHAPTWPALRLAVSALMLPVCFLAGWELYRARSHDPQMPSLASPALQMARSAWSRLRRTGVTD